MDDDELIAATVKGAARDSAAGAPAERSPRSRAGWPARSRWLVHLGLLACALAALGTLQLLHIRNAIHADVGLAFAGLVIVHLAQRRHRIAGMFARLWGFRRRARRVPGDPRLAPVETPSAIHDPIVSLSVPGRTVRL